MDSNRIGLVYSLNGKQLGSLLSLGLGASILYAHISPTSLPTNVGTQTEQASPIVDMQPTSPRQQAPTQSENAIVQPEETQRPIPQTTWWSHWLDTIDPYLPPLQGLFESTPNQKWWHPEKLLFDTFVVALFFTIAPAQVIALGELIRLFIGYLQRQRPTSHCKNKESCFTQDSARL